MASTPSPGICPLLEKTKKTGPECVLNDDQGPSPGGSFWGAQHTSVRSWILEDLRTSQVSIYIYAALEEVLFHHYKYSAFLEYPLLYSTRTAAPKHKSRPQVLTLAAHCPSPGCMLHQETHAANAGPAASAVPR